MDKAAGMAKLQALALDVFDPEMQAAIEATGGLHGISESSLTSLLLVQLLRDSMREVIDEPGGDHGAP